MRISNEREREMDTTIKALKRYWMTCPDTPLGVVVMILNNQYRLDNRSDEEFVNLLKADIDAKVAHRIDQISQNSTLSEQKKCEEIKKALSLLLIASGYNQTANKLEEE